MPAHSKVAIVGVGLIGGSIGLALRERQLAEEVVGVGRRQLSLNQALNRGAITSGTLDLAAGVADAEVVIVATPVASVGDDVCAALAAAPHEALVTDVGSTKASICLAIEQAAIDSSNFVGSHPLAGDHRSGPDFARADLLEGKVVVVTPDDNSSTIKIERATIERAKAFWQSLGARVHTMRPDEHDQALATTSHLPHLVASALAATTPLDSLPLAATGWADTTRIAAADPALWTQIFRQNTPDLVAALDRLLKQLSAARQQLQSGDEANLQQFLQQAKRIRDALGN